LKKMPDNKENLSKRFPNQKLARENLSKRFPNQNSSMGSLSKRFPNRKNKKAQVGETLTWLVATLIIIGALLLFVYFSIALANVKSIDSGNIKTKTEELSGKDVNWIEAKNEMAFSRDNSNEQIIGEWINEKQEE